MVTIALVDDHPVIRRGIKALLDSEKDFEIVGETGNGFESVQMIELLQPNIALLDLMMAGMNGIEVAKLLQHKACCTSIIIFSVLGSERYVMEALQAGVKGYVLKESPTEELIHAIREVAAGRRYLCYPLRELAYVRQTAGGDANDFFDKLTAREREVLRFSARGSTSSEVASQLNISRRTVEAHRANMMRKLGLSSATSLYRYAFQHEMSTNTPETTSL